MTDTKSFQRPAPTLAAWPLTSCALLLLPALMHHPQIRALHAQQALVAIVGVASMDRLAHAAVLVLLGGLIYGLTIFSIRQGITRPAVLGALIAYVFGAALMSAAAVIDGFLTPALAEHYVGASPGAVKDAIVLLEGSAMFIQVATALGIAATSVAIALWSCALVCSPGRPRWNGLAGLFVAAATIVVLVEIGRLTPATLLVTTAGQIGWYVLTGALLFSEGRGLPEHASTP